MDKKVKSRGNNRHTHDFQSQTVILLNECILRKCAFEILHLASDFSRFRSRREEKYFAKLENIYLFPFSTIQYNTIQHNTTQHNTTQHNATQRNATQRIATQRNATQRNATRRNAMQCNAIQ